MNEIIFLAMGMLSGYAFAKNGLVRSRSSGHSAKGPGKNPAPESEVDKPPRPPPSRGSSVITSGPQKCPQCGHFHDEPLECQKKLQEQK